MRHHANNSKRQTRAGLLTQRSGIAFCLAAGFLCVSATPRQARADELWNQTKRYTAQVVGVYEAAVEKLKEAKDALDDAKDVLAALRAALSAAGGAIANPALAARVAQAVAAVAAAEGVVAAAAKAVAVATAAAAAFLGGTCVGQGANYLISWCWDPVCELDGAAAYSFPQDAQVDLWIEQMLLTSTGVAVTKADFDAAEAAFPGTGAVSWQYLRESVRTYSIAARGIGAYTTSQYDEVLAASRDLQNQTEDLAVATHVFANHFSTAQTYMQDPRAQMADAINQVQMLLPDINQFPDPVGTQQLIQDAVAAMNQAMAALDDISAFPGGPPVALDGDVFQPLTIANYQQFLDQCRIAGAAALPQAEVRAVDDLMVSLGLNNRGQSSMGPDIAFWDGVGDTANEAARFGTGGVSLNAEILIDATNFYWRNIDLSESPLVHNALADRQGAFTEFEAPLFFPGQLLPSSGWMASPDLPGSDSFHILSYPPSPLGIPYLMGGRGQFIGAAAPGFGQFHECATFLPPPPLPPMPLLPPVVVGLDLHLQGVVLQPPGLPAASVSVQGAVPAPGVRVEFQTMPGNQFQPVVQAVDPIGGIVMVPLPPIESGWHHMSLVIDPQSGDVMRFTLINNGTAQGTVIENPGWSASPAGVGFGHAERLGFRVGGQGPPGSVVMGVDNVSVASLVDHCAADLTTGAVAGQQGYGIPDGVLNNEDFFYYLAQFAAGNAVVADLTSGAVPGQPGYGVPNGVINNEDFFYYLAIFAAGC